MALASVIGALAFMGLRGEVAGSAGMNRFVALPPVKPVSSDAIALHAEPLSEALRAKGYHECYPHDPIGLGPYGRYRNVSMGRLLVPQKGGHTSDMGYDVVIHFHGHEAVRKTLVQVARGVAYVGIDKGLGSGAYETAFNDPSAFTTLLYSIEKGLQAESRDPRAHIRKLALSAWSAGYGAVNEILKHHADAVDAVVLLDGLHGRWEALPNRDPSKPLKTTQIAPTIEFARRAARGEKIFVFTHSFVDPVDYTPTCVTADLLLIELGLKRELMDPGSNPFGQSGKSDSKGFHLWSYRGKNEHAHCTHISHVAKALSDVIEPAWRTPAMDRGVPFTKAPKLGNKVAADGPIELDLEGSLDEPEIEEPLE